jgi:RNA polymerase sigma-70 factor (ECF subfamily)
MPDWQEIMSTEGPAVWRTAYRLLAHRADADECFQEAFVDALELSRRQEIRDWGGLLRRLATVRSIDRLRQRRRSGIRETEKGRESLEIHAPSASQAIEDAELSTRLRAALASIPAKQAQAFCLLALEEWNYREISDAMAISVNAVGVLIHRARKRLQRRLTKHTEVPDPPSRGLKRNSVPPTARKELP